MKKIFLLFALFLSLSVYATVRTVSNSPATLAQFSNIQAAIDAASNGDSIYVHGSPAAYAYFTITDKQLTIIGPGWTPDKQLPFSANVPGCTITGAASSNTEIQGIVFTGGLVLYSIKPDNLRFIRNYFVQGASINIFQGSVTYSGYLFEGNIFDNMAINASAGSTYQNFLFQNNIFYETGCCVGPQISSFVNSVNVLFNHNLFYGPAYPAGGPRDVFGGNTRFLSLTNNIFIKRNAANQNTSSTFNNNITYGAGNNTPWATVNGNVDAGGNVTDQDPLMFDQAAVNAGTMNGLLNFTIAAGPANNSGSDLKDMGLLYDPVGSLNWNNSRGSRLPFIYSMNITNPTIPAGGTLSVVVEARKNN